MSMVRFEGKDPKGEKVTADLPLILALRGEEPALPGVDDKETISASILQSTDGGKTWS